MTDIPSALMTVIAVALAMRESRAALCAAAVFLVLAAFFRLQSFIALPGLVLLNWTIWGWRRGTVRSVVLVALVVVLHVLVTLGLEARYPGYWNAVYNSHVSRASISLGLRALRVHDMLQKPEVLLGLIAALWLTASPNRRVRAVAFVALTTTFLTAFGAKSLYSHYFLLPLPFCSICLAVLVGNWLATSTHRWPVLFCVLLVSGEHLYDCANRVRSGRKLHAEYARRLTTVRQIPEKIVLANPRYVVLGGKTFPEDYWMPDYFMPQFQGWFDDWVDEWVEMMYAKSEAIIIDEEFANNRVGEHAHKWVHYSDKPIYFIDAEARQAWESRVNLPSQPTK